MEDRKFKSWCPSCRKETIIEEVKLYKGHEATGLADEALLECSSCGHTFRV